MEIVITIDGKEVKLSEETVDSIRKQLGAEEKSDCGFVDLNCLNKGEEYYSIYFKGTVGPFTFCRDEADKMLNNFLNAFTSKEFAEKVRDMQLLERKLYKFSMENGGDKINWNNQHQEKYYIAYRYRNELGNRLKTNYVCSNRDFGQIYFISEKVAQMALNKFKHELIEYFNRK